MTCIGGGSSFEVGGHSARALLGRSGGIPPRKILDFRPSEIIFGAVLGQMLFNNGQSAISCTAKASYPGYKANAKLIANR